MKPTSTRRQPAAAALPLVLACMMLTGCPPRAETPVLGDPESPPPQQLAPAVTIAANFARLVQDQPGKIITLSAQTAGLGPTGISIVYEVLPSPSAGKVILTPGPGPLEARLQLVNPVTVAPGGESVVIRCTATDASGRTAVTQLPVAMVRSEADVNLALRTDKPSRRIDETPLRFRIIADTFGGSGDFSFVFTVLSTPITESNPLDPTVGLVLPVDPMNPGEAIANFQAGPLAALGITERLGVWTVRCQLTDNQSGLVRDAITQFAVTPRPISATLIPELPIQDVSLTNVLTATAIGGNGTLTFRFVILPPGFDPNTDPPPAPLPPTTVTGQQATFNFTPAAGIGTYGLVVRVSDQADQLAEAVVPIVVIQNTPPIANAGDDQTVNSGTLVSLNGLASADPDGDLLSYLWQQLLGPPVTLNNTASPTPTFTAPAVMAPTLIRFQLTVNDGRGGTATDTVDITVNPAVNDAPIVNAGADQTVTAGDLVLLGGQVFDPNNDPLTIAWTQVSPAVPALSLADPASPVTSFVAPVVLMPTIFTLRLSASDGLLTGQDDVLITVNPAAAPPVAPIVTLPGAVPTYTEGDAAPALIDATATVTDADSTNLDGGELRIAHFGGGLPEDSLQFVPNADVATAGAVGDTLSVNGQVIGTLTADGTAGADLAVALNAQATPARVQTALRRVGYANTSQSPLAGFRTLSVTVRDDTGLTSAAASKNVLVVAVNDPPTLTIIPVGMININEFASLSGAGLVLADPDADTGELDLTITTSGGTILLSPGFVVVAGASGTTSVTVRGTLGSLNALLAMVNNVRYQAPAAAGPQTITYTLDDRGAFPPPPRTVQLVDMVNVQMP